MSAMPNRDYQEALSLPADERINLVELLLQSLNNPLQPDIEGAWQAEAERRIALIETEEAETIPAEEALKRIRERYQ